MTIFGFAVPLGPQFDPRTEHALQSLADQQSDDVTVRIAICDVSDSEECRALADRFGALVTYRRHGPDDGQAAAIAEGWNAVKADIYGWLNADDLLTQGALARVLRAFDEDDAVDVVCGQSRIIGDEPSDTELLHPEVEAPTTLLYRSNIISQPSCFVRAEALHAVGGINPDLHYTMDWDLWVRLMEAGRKFVYVPDVLSEVYWGEGTKTSALNRRRVAELWQVVRRNCGPLRSSITIASFARHHFATYLAGRHSAQS